MSRGKRIQIYLPADLLERWNNTPRYERSAEVAIALRKHWGMVKNPKIAPDIAQSEPLHTEIDEDKPH
jgi:hypothetical protein